MPGSRYLVFTYLVFMYLVITHLIITYLRVISQFSLTPRPLLRKLIMYGTLFIRRFLVIRPFQLLRRQHYPALRIIPHSALFHALRYSILFALRYSAVCTERFVYTLRSLYGSGRRSINRSSASNIRATMVHTPNAPPISTEPIW